MADQLWLMTRIREEEECKESIKLVLDPANAEFDLRSVLGQSMAGSDTSRNDTSGLRTRNAYMYNAASELFQPERYEMVLCSLSVLHTECQTMV